MVVGGGARRAPAAGLGWGWAGAESDRDGAQDVALGVQQASPGSCVTLASSAPAPAFLREAYLSVRIRPLRTPSQGMREGARAPSGIADTVCRRK